MQSSPTLNPLHERLLVLRAQEGDSDAFRILWDTYEAKLLYFLRRFSSDEHIAHDLLQEVWLDVFRKIGELRGAEAFRRWLYQIAHNRAVSRIRSERRESEVLECVLAESDVEAIDEFARSDRAEAVHIALGRLDVQQRVVITLRFLEDLTIAEIAEVLKLSPGTVKSRLHYGKQALRRILEKEQMRG